MNKRPILVTGGAGFIGSHLVRRLVGGGSSVAVLAKETTDLRRIRDFLPHLIMLRDDLSDRERLGRLLAGMNPRGVFHCAASNIQSGVAAPEEELVRVNSIGIINLLKALDEVGYEFFVHCGSFLEYGVKNKPSNENDVCEPAEVYALTKLTATLYCQALGRHLGKPVVTLRIFTPYGPDMGKGRLVYEVVERALHNKEIILTKPETTRDFIFIDDLVELFFEVARKAYEFKGEIFNAGSGTAVTLRDFADYTLRITDSKSAVRWNCAREPLYDRGFWQADMNKTHSAFGWRPAYPIEAGIRKTVDWFVSRGGNL